ncbi:MAG: DUF5675 family protein [Odoribacter splanchnicus]
MELELHRLYLRETYTIGRLSVGGVYFCDTLEDRVRDLSKVAKVPGATAVPAGRYEVVVNYSPRFRRDLPRLLDVPGFTGILIHRGNTAADTAGCILVGENREKGKVVNSTPYEQRLTAMLLEAQTRGEKTYITII